MYLFNKYSRMSRHQVCLDMCAQSKITQDVTNCYVIMYINWHMDINTLRSDKRNRLIWKLPLLILCPIEIIVIIYGWLIDYLLFYVPLKNVSLIWRRHHCRRRAAKFRPMLGAQGLWAGRDLNSATPAVTRDLGFSGLIRKTAPLVASYDTRGDVEDLF
jgi:hypothetical protein